MAQLPSYLPMLAETGPLPSDDEQWAYEMKWDGVRALAYLQDGPLRLISRTGKDFTIAYPELGALAEAVQEPTVLDGEIIALGPDGRPSFEALQARMHLRQPAKIAELAKHSPVTLMLFDVLHIGDQPLITHPYAERRQRLAALALPPGRWAVPDVFNGGGAEAFAASGRLGLEGIVAKRLDSLYLPGRRNRTWAKIKNFRTQEVIIIGWAPGQGRREGLIGALLLAIHDHDATLTYVGQVGTGFSHATLDDLARQLAPLEQAEPAADVPRIDARGARWVRPELVGEVTYAAWTASDTRLRHPSWRGLRPDKRTTEVYREP